MVRSRGVGDNNNGLQELRDQCHNLLLLVVERPNLKGQSLVAWMGKQLREKILPEVCCCLSTPLCVPLSLPAVRLSLCSPLCVPPSLSLDPRVTWNCRAQAASGLQPSGEVVFLIKLNFDGCAPADGWTWSHFAELCTTAPNREVGEAGLLRCEVRGIWTTARPSEPAQGAGGKAGCIDAGANSYLVVRFGVAPPEGAGALNLDLNDTPQAPNTERRTPNPEP